MHNSKLFLYHKSKKMIKKKYTPKRLYNLIINKSESDSLEKFSIINKRLPQKVDLRNKFPPIYDQGSLGSCTANALCGLIQYLQPEFQGSRLFLYYNERKLENDISDDSGATLTSGIKSLLKHGICLESNWPYIINKFAVKPDDICYIEALEHQALKVKSINETLQTMKSSLANGNPFVVGILIYESFEYINVSRKGKVPMPKINKEQILGGHAIVCVGYNNITKEWIMRNSWGNSWGDNGYFYLPYNYLLNPNLASDMWTITKME